MPIQNSMPSFEGLILNSTHKRVGLYIYRFGAQLVPTLDARDYHKSEFPIVLKQFSNWWKPSPNGFRFYITGIYSKSIGNLCFHAHDCVPFCLPNPLWGVSLTLYSDLESFIDIQQQIPLVVFSPYRMMRNILGGAAAAIFTFVCTPGAQHSCMHACARFRRRCTFRCVKINSSAANCALLHIKRVGNDCRWLPRARDCANEIEANIWSDKTVVA
jgi:hypothetical protein